MQTTQTNEEIIAMGQVKAWDDAHVMSTYKRQPVEFVRGDGVYLFDTAGRKYLDLLAGIAVCSVGHAHPYLTNAIATQAATLLHTSNLYLTAPQARLARRLCELSDFDRVFFCNSGAEANECAIKIARKFGKAGGNDKKHRIVTAKNSFHGRTLATVTATGQPKYSQPFAPLPAGFDYVPFNNPYALASVVNEETAAILLEPIQGEGGIIPASDVFLQTARRLADKFGALLIFDEVQTGVGRTGKLWGYQNYGVVPDIMTLAKGLGGGVPIGACLTRGMASETLVPGDHGTTFGGNPLATTAANAVLDILADEHLTRNAETVGAFLQQALQQLIHTFPAIIGEVRGAGLMLGIGLKQPVARQIVANALEWGLILNATSDDTLRLVPPLILTEAQASDAVALLTQALAALPTVNTVI